jgi:hypothetical protein
MEGKSLGKVRMGEIYGMDNFHAVPKLSLPAATWWGSGTCWYLPAAPRNFSLSPRFGPMKSLETAGSPHIICEPPGISMDSCWATPLKKPLQGEER